eukprot:9481421-Pyramimonas_sp.AAC.1
MGFAAQGNAMWVHFGQLWAAPVLQLAQSRHGVRLPRACVQVRRRLLRVRPARLQGHRWRVPGGDLRAPGLRDGPLEGQRPN